jgi:uroporphyrinogen decarboxylase
MLLQTHERLKTLLGIESETRFDETTLVAEIDEAILNHFDIDTRLVAYVRPLLDTTKASDRRQALLGDGYVDGWGVTWKAADGQPGTPIRGPLEGWDDPADLDRHVWPDPDDPAFTAGLREQAQNLRQSSDQAIVMGFPGRVFTFGQFMCGMEDWLIKLKKNVPFASALMDKGLEIQMTIVGHMLDAVGDNVDIVYCAEDLGMQSGPIISPDLYRTLIKPRHRRLFDFVKSRTSAKLLLHTDGSIVPLMGDLIDIGVDAINPVQVSTRGMGDTAWLKQEFGRHLSFWGAIDTRYALPFGTPQEVREEVRRRIEDLAPGGGYILASVHNMQSEVPAENICAMFEAARDYGTYA